MDNNTRFTPKGEIEDRFRCRVRDALDLDIFSRDDQIVEKIRQLMRQRDELLGASLVAKDVEARLRSQVKS